MELSNIGIEVTYKFTINLELNETLYERLCLESQFMIDGVSQDGKI